MSPTTIPVSVTPEAAERVAELGMQAELECMLEHTRQTVPGLRSIEVRLALPYDTGDVPTIIIEAAKCFPARADEPTQTEWDDWQMNTFPPDVYRHFLLMTLQEPTHEG